jgi:hypothetical protein
MQYFKVNNKDISQYVSSLKIGKKSIYTSKTNAAGDTVVDYKNAKRTFQVGIIPLDSEAMTELMVKLNSMVCTISCRNPLTNIVEDNIRCILPDTEIEYYTIQVGKVMYKALTLTFIEL